MSAQDKQVEKIRQRHEDFIRQYSPGPDWEPCNTMSEDRGYLLTVVAQLRAALQAVAHYAHPGGLPYDAECPGCKAVEALRAGEENTGGPFMCSARRNGRDDGDPCMKIEGHDGAHKFVKIRPLRAGGETP